MELQRATNTQSHLHVTGSLVSHHRTAQGRHQGGVGVEQAGVALGHVQLVHVLPVEAAGQTVLGLGPGGCRRLLLGPGDMELY